MNWSVKFALAFALSAHQVSASDAINQPALEHHQWKIVSYWNGSAMATPLRRMRIDRTHYKDWPLPSITFANKMLSGSPGCAALNGTYSLSGHDLTIKSGWLLAGFCPYEATKQDDAICNDLNSVRSWKSRGDEIALLDGESHVRVILRP